MATTRIFVCHNSLDKEQAEDIALALLKAGGARTWLDRWEIRGGSDWEAHLREEFSATSQCLVLVGPHGLGPFQRQEIKWARERRGLDSTYLVIPVILPGATEAALQQVAAELPGLQWVSLQSGWASHGMLDSLLAALRGDRPGPPAFAISVAVAAEQWEGGGRSDTSGLLRGRALAAARKLASQPGIFDELSQSFIAASVARGQTRLQWALGGLATLTVFIAAIAWWVNGQRVEAEAARKAETMAREGAEAARNAETEAREEAQRQGGEALKARTEAERQRGIADEKAVEARSQRDQALQAARRNLADNLAAQSASLLRSNPQRATLLAAEAVKATSVDKHVTPSAHAALHTSLKSSSGLGLFGHTDTIKLATFSADESLLATASIDKAIRVWRLGDLRSVECVAIAEEAAFVRFLAFDRAAKHLVSLAASPDDRAGIPWIWKIDPADRYPKPLPFTSLRMAATTFATSAQGDLLAVATVDSKVSIYTFEDASQPRLMRQLSMPPGLQAQKIIWSADSEALVAGTTTNQVVLWNLGQNTASPAAVVAAEHRRLGAFPNESLHVDLLDISKDKSLLLTGVSGWIFEGNFADPNLQLWKLRGLAPTGPPVAVDQAKGEINKAISAAFFSDDSQLLIASTEHGSAKAWRVDALMNAAGAPQEPLTSLKHTGSSSAAAIPASRGFFALGQGREISIMDTSVGPDRQFRGRKVLASMDGNVEAVALSRTGRFLAAGGGDRIVRVWHLDAPESSPAGGGRLSMPYGQGELLALGKSGMTAILARGTSVEVWNLSSLASPTLLRTEPEAIDPEEECSSCQILLSPDERWILLRDQFAKDRFQAIELRPPGRRFKIDASVRRFPRDGLRFTEDGRWLFANESQSSVSAYALDGPEAGARLPMSPPAGKWSLSSLSVDSAWAVLKQDVNVHKDPLGRDRSVGFIAPAGVAAGSADAIDITGFERGIGSAVFSQNGRWLALGGNSTYKERERDDRRVQLWRFERSWKKALEVDAIEYAASKLVFSPDGRWLLTGSSDIMLGDRTVSARIWPLGSKLDASSGQKLPDVLWNLKAATFSPDSRWLVTVSGAADFAQLWDVSGSSIRPVARLGGPKPRYNNSWRIVFGSDSASVVIWTIDDDTPFFWRLNAKGISQPGERILNGDRSIGDVAYSKDGKLLALVNSDSSFTGLADPSAHLTLVDLTQFPNPGATTTLDVGSAAHSVVFRNPGDPILLAGKTLTLLRPEPEELLKNAESAVGRNFTWEEWVKAGIVGRYRPTFPGKPVGADVLLALTDELAGLPPDTPAAKGWARELATWALRLGDGRACNRAAWEVARRGDPVQALALADCAVGHSPREANFRDTRGLALALNGRLQEARAEFEYYIQQADRELKLAPFVPLRKRWVEQLKAGRNPFGANRAEMN